MDVIINAESRLAIGSDVLSMGLPWVGITDNGLAIGSPWDIGWSSAGAARSSFG